MAIVPSGADRLLHRSSLFSLPHDPASVVVYVLLIASGFAIWYGDHQARKRSTRKTADGPSGPHAPNPGDGPAASGTTDGEGE